MEIILVSTGEKKQVTIQPITSEDLKLLTKKRYSFLWKKLADEASLFKLCLMGEEDILGVMALVDFQDDQRIEIKLLATSIENVGKSKMYDGIAGLLVAYACREAVKKYADMACVSLVPKTKLRSHYIEKYGMMVAGKHLFLEGNSLKTILLKHLS